MSIRFFLSLLVLGIGAVGCTPSGSGNSSSNPDSLEDTQNKAEQFREMLLGKAQALAERDLAKMMATELLYRNVPEFFSPIHQGRQKIVPLWIKQYRHFNSYEIKDIYRSDSYLYPIVYEIHYPYHYLTTRLKETMGSNKEQVREIAKNDYNFKKVSSDTIIRRYRCDANGNYIGDLPEVLPRPIYEFFTSTERIPEKNEGIPNPTPPR